MARVHYLVKFENEFYANDLLYAVAVAGTMCALTAKVKSGQIVPKSLLGAKVYPLDRAEQLQCELYNPAVQDFDDAVKHFNILPKDTVVGIKNGTECLQAFPGAAVVAISKTFVAEVFEYKQFKFFKAKAYVEDKKYHIIPKTAHLKLLGNLYIAVNAVDVRIDAPIIATINE